MPAQKAATRIGEVMSTLQHTEPYARQQSADARYIDRLRLCAEALLRSNRRLIVIGENEAVHDLALDHGLDRQDYCLFQVKLGARSVCLVCVPSSHWHYPPLMKRFLEMKAAAEFCGHQVLLVPETFIRRQPRLGNSQLLARSMDLEVTGTDRMTVMCFLLENGGGTLSEVAGLLQHDDPVGAVLHLASVGAVDIDLGAMIAPATRVSFPAVRS